MQNMQKCVQICKVWKHDIIWKYAYLKVYIPHFADEVYQWPYEIF